LDVVTHELGKQARRYGFDHPGPGLTKKIKEKEQRTTDWNYWPREKKGEEGEEEVFRRPWGFGASRAKKGRREAS